MLDFDRRRWIQTFAHWWRECQIHVVLSQQWFSNLRSIRRPTLLLLLLLLLQYHSTLICIVILLRLFDNLKFSPQKNEIFLFFPSCPSGLLEWGGPSVCRRSRRRRFHHHSVRCTAQDCWYGIIVEIFCCCRRLMMDSVGFEHCGVSLVCCVLPCVRWWIGHFCRGVWAFLCLSLTICPPVIIVCTRFTHHSSLFHFVENVLELIGNVSDSSVDHGQPTTNLI
jgi:hypothetical protein